MKYTVSGHVTCSPNDAGVWHSVNCTVASDFTLPVAMEGAWIGVFNYGSEALTVKDLGGSTLAVLTTNQGAVFWNVENGSGPTWERGASSIPLMWLPPGGTTGQVLAKASDADYDVEWVTP